MAKLHGWIAKNVILPLAPFFIVAIFRFIYQGWNIAILEPGLLSFSMAMLCLMITKSANKLFDPDDRDIVYYLFIVFMILFLALSVGVSVIEIQNQTSISTNLHNFNYSEPVNGDASLVLQTIDKTMTANSDHIITITDLTLFFTIAVVILAIIFKIKYKLED